MLVIRLQRTGRRNLAAYRVVVAEKHRAVKKQVVGVVGHYLPMQNPKVVEINLEKVLEWIAKGAQPSPTVASLLKQLGASNMEKYLGKPNKHAKKKKAAEEAPEAPVASVASVEAPSTSVEEPVVAKEPAEVVEEK